MPYSDNLFKKFFYKKIKEISIKLLILLIEYINDYFNANNIL